MADMTSPTPPAVISTRLARDEDIPIIRDIEVSAAQLFRTVDLAWVAESPPQDAAVLRSMIEAHHLWVAVDTQDTPVGFVAVQVLDGMFYIAEIDVEERWQRKGIARRMLEHVEREAREQGFEYMSLTTYRDLAFNGPFYAKLGFVEVDGERAGGEHVNELGEQGRHGHDLSRRCVMWKRL
ncbi:GNAT family N-acetyltransferase [Aspergillus clavatus NRRL 1]|uniref:GNAT family acetyltransferase, putative n=1 Tax=Aspergillus clavatus (strain ATCC 1007 / CBS 513.65 / DSM 816 / NCTC 3887 / NRRL 1 / QM 1276 / 107) TaxID=344612 RepID=A1CIW2_ASPCL|nr:GNAT family acetyltransferase, putative [Aspergillus clavatus NRRL 1]EAW10817.1 GNAT family acetyltransferase, putative [Aspergillus clavatus NRRL 1]